MFKRYVIHRFPACTELSGKPVAACWGVSLVDSRNNSWDGGEFPTREEAVAKGEEMTRK